MMYYPSPYNPQYPMLTPCPIPVYLSSVLRSSTSSGAPQVREFLGLHLLGGAAAVIPVPSPSPGTSSAVAEAERWRKLFMAMRIRLKPRDIAVRCRLFEGVFAGEDVAGWLMKNSLSTSSEVPDATSSSTSSLLSIARDRSEAIAIAQELLAAGLLVAVCAGFSNDTPEEVDEEAQDTPEEVEDGQQLTPISTPSEVQQVQGFSVMAGFIYRFPGKSDTAGSWSLFGAPVSLRIPTMSLAEDGEVTKSSRDTVALTVMTVGSPGSGTSGLLVDDLLLEPGTSSSSGKEVSQGSGAFVKYLIDITHGADCWQTARRYREFEGLHRALLKEGVKPEAPLPAKTFVKLNRGPTVDDSRRQGLEHYLRSALQATVDAGAGREHALLALALFLDEDFHHLRILNDSSF